MQTLGALSVCRFTRAVFGLFFSMRLGQLCFIWVKISSIGAGGCNGGLYRIELCALLYLRRTHSGKGEVGSRAVPGASVRPLSQPLIQAECFWQKRRKKSSISLHWLSKITPGLWVHQHKIHDETTSSGLLQVYTVVLWCCASNLSMKPFSFLFLFFFCFFPQIGDGLVKSSFQPLWICGSLKCSQGNPSRISQRAWPGIVHMSSLKMILWSGQRNFLEKSQPNPANPEQLRRGHKSSLPNGCLRWSLSFPKQS